MYFVTLQYFKTLSWNDEWYSIKMLHCIVQYIKIILVLIIVFLLKYFTYLMQFMLNKRCRLCRSEWVASKLVILINSFGFPTEKCLLSISCYLIRFEERSRKVKEQPEEFMKRLLLLLLLLLLLRLKNIFLRNHYRYLKKNDKGYI